MAEPVVILNPSWAARQFVPGGSANRFVNTRARRAVHYASLLAPRRSGELARGMKKTGTLNQGPWSAVCTIYNDAPHAHFVVFGTIGKVIVPRGPKPMPIPVNRGLPRRLAPGNLFISRWRVRGQVPNDFMATAVEWAFPDGIHTWE